MTDIISREAQIGAVISAYDQANPMRTADIHSTHCDCLRCAIDALRATPASRQDTITNLADVTRVEVIDETGRAYTRWRVSVELSTQDQGRTLKMFVKPAHQDEP